MTPKGTHKPVIQGTFTPAATFFGNLEDIGLILDTKRVKSGD